MMPGVRTGSIRAFRRRDFACQCAGAAGSVLSCAGMILALAAGFFGAAGGAAAHTGMAGMESMGGAPPAQQGGSPLPAGLAFLNRIAVPLLLVSIVLMLVGVARAGWRAVALVALGSALLLASMAAPSLQAQVWLLGGGFASVIAGYVVTWRATKLEREAAP